MIENDSEKFYWMENEPNKEKNVLTKIYTPKTDRGARVRALRERVALEHLTGIFDHCIFLASSFGFRALVCTEVAPKQFRCFQQSFLAKRTLDDNEVHQWRTSFRLYQI